MITTPKTIGNLTFDRLSMQLAVNATYRPDGSPDASISIVLTPLAVANGEVVTADQGQIQILRGHLTEITDPAEQACVAAIQSALQAFVTAKGF